MNTTRSTSCRLTIFITSSKWFINRIYPSRKPFSFTDVPKSQTLALLKSQKSDGFCILSPSRCIRKLVGSTDHFSRLEEDGRGNGEAERLGGLEVDNQLELRGLLHRQVGRLGALEDFVHVIGGPPVHLCVAGSIRHQSPGLD